MSAKSPSTLSDVLQIAMTRNYPIPEIPEEHILALARMVAQTSWLPHPETVRTFGRAVFPALRARTGKPRLSQVLADGDPVGMYDDNVTPAWALFWSQQISLAAPASSGQLIARHRAAGRPIRSTGHTPGTISKT
jgi:hypothetical protein